MVGRRVLNEAMSKMVNAERRRVAMVKLQPMSFIIAEFLKIMKYRGYIKDYKIYDPHYVGRIEVELSGKIKDCRTLMYRQDYEASQLPQFLRKFLPTQQWGYLVLATRQGLMDHEKAMKEGIGGRILGYFY